MGFANSWFRSGTQVAVGPGGMHKVRVLLAHLALERDISRGGEIHNGRAAASNLHRVLAGEQLPGTPGGAAGLGVTAPSRMKSASSYNQTYVSPLSSQLSESTVTLGG